MKTTINLDAQLLAQAKKFAAHSGMSLSSIVEDALRESLCRRVHIPTFGGQGLKPGVDINNSAALLDLMESDRYARLREQRRRHTRRTR